jgi:hypothetical protein
MTRDRNPFVTAGGVVLLVLGVLSLMSSYRDFGGNAYFNYGMLVLGLIVLLIAVLSRVKGSMGLVLAGIWLLAMGLLNIYRVGFVYDNYLMAILPVAAAILMFFGI